ncbi:hypothetical protein SBA6_470064 [Candidatus Sulfopaludibacter sp. SbA6]|nr:hypothetical protein SBA6_470064 [Candidatus Sulfopaludibacter sp. SbA6]
MASSRVIWVASYLLKQFRVRHGWRRHNQNGRTFSRKVRASAGVIAAPKIGIVLVQLARSLATRIEPSGVQGPLNSGPSAGAGPGYVVCVTEDPLSDANNDSLRESLRVGPCAKKLHPHSGRVCPACEFQAAVSVHDVDYPCLRIAPYADQAGAILIEHADIRQVPIPHVSRVFAARLEPVPIGLYAVSGQLLKQLFLFGCVHGYFRTSYFNSNASDAMDGHATTRLL